MWRQRRRVVDERDAGMSGGLVAGGRRIAAPAPAPTQPAKPAPRTISGKWHGEGKQRYEGGERNAGQPWIADHAPPDTPARLGHDGYHRRFDPVEERRHRRQRTEGDI